MCQRLLIAPLIHNVNFVRVSYLRMDCVCGQNVGQ